MPVRYEHRLVRDSRYFSRAVRKVVQISYGIARYVHYDKRAYADGFFAGINKRSDENDVDLTIHEN